jgi:RES domain-containing protein
VSNDLTTSLRGQGWVCRAIDLPQTSTLDLISDKPNRWNAEGEPTIYVSGDPGLALVESGRHPSDLEDGLRMFDMQLDLPRTVDLRDGRVRGALSLPDDLQWILDQERTRELGRSLRRSGDYDALIVPSAGALDTPERYNVVVFADDRARIPELVAELRPAGELRLSSEGA